jgi:predicted  nucleic acid-binding Zn-ribbon protein
VTLASVQHLSTEEQDSIQAQQAELQAAETALQQARAELWQAQQELKSTAQQLATLRSGADLTVLRQKLADAEQHAVHCKEQVEQRQVRGQACQLSALIMLH